MDNINNILVYCKSLNWGYDWIKEYGDDPVKESSISGKLHARITGSAITLWRWANESYMHEEHNISKDDLMHIGRHLLVCVDAMKHKLDWKRSYEENIENTGILDKYHKAHPKKA